jgi:DMSO/TMAO reductase YedYZ heme-binding membrane subunit
MKHLKQQNWKKLQKWFWVYCVIHFLFIVPISVGAGFYQINLENKQLFYIVCGVLGAFAFKRTLDLFRKGKKNDNRFSK